jgi:hypothetical protein
MKFRVFWDVLACSQLDVDRPAIALMIEAARTSETSVDIKLRTLRTRQYIPEDSELQQINTHESFFYCTSEGKLTLLVAIIF